LSKGIYPLGQQKIGLKQAKANKLGCWTNAFSGYERNVTHAHKSTVALLWLLDSHPGFLKEVSMMQSRTSLNFALKFTYQKKWNGKVPLWAKCPSDAPA
jgi:hypothetical protein